MFKLQSTSELLLWIALIWLKWLGRAEDLKLHKWETERDRFPVHSGLITKALFLPPTLSFRDFRNKMPFSYSCQRNNNVHAKANNEHVQTKPQKMCIVFMGGPYWTGAAPHVVNQAQTIVLAFTVSVDVSIPVLKITQWVAWTLFSMFQNTQGLPGHYVFPGERNGCTLTSANKQGVFCHNDQLLTSLPTPPFSDWNICML